MTTFKNMIIKYMSVENYLILHNFLLLCTKYHLERNLDLLEIHETATKQLLDHEKHISFHQIQYYTSQNLME